MILNTEEQVLRTGLSKDGKSLVSGICNLSDPFLGRHMDDVEMCAGKFRELDRPVHSFALGDGRSCDAVVDRVRLPSLERLGAKDVNCHSIFCVHHDQGACLCCLLHRTQDGPVV